MISLAPTTVGRIKNVFDTNGRDTYQHHLVVDGGGVDLTREESRQRKSRKRIVSPLEIEYNW